MTRFSWPTACRICAAAAAALLPASISAAESTSRPSGIHVLVIHSDQHRFDCLGAMGNPDVRTPNLDALAADGVLFRNSFCTWPVCTPSRYSLLSGQYVRQHRGRTNACTLAPGTPTYANILRSAGYTTKAVGKMHFMPAYLDVGFSELQLAEQNGRGRLVDDYHRYLKEHDLIDSVDLIDQEQPFRGHAPDSYWETFGAGVSNLPEEHHSTTWIGNRAVETLSSWKADRPGLLMAGFIKPHHPFDPPAPWNAMYDPQKLTILPGWVDEPLERDVKYRPGYFDNRKLTLPALRRVMAHYYATISQIDAQVGRMIDTLKKAGLYDRTLIIYTADHGEFMGFHHLVLKGNNMYDPLAKVPLIIKFPQQAYAGKVSDALVSSIDVTRTIVSEAGLKPGPDMNGRPLRPVAAGQAPGRKLIFTETDTYIMVRSPTRKLLYGGNTRDSFFFDLEKDPLEMDDRFSDPQYQSDVREMKDALLQWLQIETLTTTPLNMKAPQIKAANVPPDREAAEREMEAYIRRKMDAVMDKK